MTPHDFDMENIGIITWK